MLGDAREILPPVHDGEPVVRHTGRVNYPRRASGIAKVSPHADRIVERAMATRSPRGGPVQERKTQTTDTGTATGDGSSSLAALPLPTASPRVSLSNPPGGAATTTASPRYHHHGQHQQQPAMRGGKSPRGGATSSIPTQGLYTVEQFAAHSPTTATHLQPRGGSNTSKPPGVGVSSPSPSSPAPPPPGRARKGSTATRAGADAVHDPSALEYNHKRRLALQVTPWFWPENGEADRAFASTALQCETKMREALAGNAIGQHAVADAQRTATVCFVLDQIAAAPGPLSSFFTALKEEVFLSIYEGYTPPALLPGHGNDHGNNHGNGNDDDLGATLDDGSMRLSRKFYEHTPYFEAIEQLRAANVRLRRELETVQAESDAHKSGAERLNQLMHELRTQHTRGTMDIAEFKLQNGHLQNELSTMRQRVADAAQENDYLRSQLTELVADINKFSKAKDKLDEIGDLKAANQNLAEELTLVMKEREFWRERVEHMVPKEELEAAVRSKNETLRSMYTLKASIKQLQDKYDEVLPIAAEWLDRRSAMTPRPDFAKVCGEQELTFVPIEGPTEARVRQLCDVATEYRAQVEALKLEIEDQRDEIQELKLYVGEDKDDAAEGGAGGAPAAKQFVGLGTGPDVPKYLRFTGKIRNRNLTQRELEILIRDVWSQKADYDSHRRSAEPLANYFYLYLQKRFGIQSMIAEWGYNVVDALQRLSETSTNARLFLSVLNGDTHEATAQDQDRLINGYLRARLEKVDHMDEGKSTGVIVKKTLFNMLPKIFPDKSKDQILALKRAIHLDFPGKSVPYTKLWDRTSDGSTGNFLSAIRAMHLDDVELYVRQLAWMLRHCPRDARGHVPLISVRDCIISLDPLKRPHEVDAYLARGSGLPPGSLTPSHSVDPARFVADLRGSGLVARSLDHLVRYEEKERRKATGTASGSGASGSKSKTRAASARNNNNNNKNNNNNSSSSAAASRVASSSLAADPYATNGRGVSMTWVPVPKGPRHVPSKAELDAEAQAAATANGGGGHAARSANDSGAEAGGSAGAAAPPSSSASQHLIIKTTAGSAYDDPEKLRQHMERKAMLARTESSAATAGAVGAKSAKKEGPS